MGRPSRTISVREGRKWDVAEGKFNYETDITSFHPVPEVIRSWHGPSEFF